MNTVLELKNITKEYKNRKKNILVLKDINYKFSKGKLYTISGKSGSGKTTIMNILGLLVEPSSGSILLYNNSIEKLSETKKARIRNENIGFIFQSFYLNENMTTLENVMLPSLIKGSETKKEIIQRANNKLKEVDLGERMNHFPSELSGGEQQRVAIARALMNNPDIILADEPTGSLDPENEKIIMDILKQLTKEGKCVIVVTHSMTVKKYSDVKLNISNHKIEEAKDEK